MKYEYYTALVINAAGSRCYDIGVHSNVYVGYMCAGICIALVEGLRRFAVLSSVGSVPWISAACQACKLRRFFWRARERSSKFKCCCFGVFLNAVYAICMQKAARACHWSTVLCAKRYWGFPLEFKKRSSIDHRVTQAIFMLWYGQ